MDFKKLIEKEIHFLGKMLKENLSHKLDQLVFFIENDREIYTKDIKPTLNIMKRKLQAGNFDKNAMLRVFDKIVTKAATKFEKEEFDSAMEFSNSDIKKVAEHFLEFWLDEWEVNKLDGV